jgi:hypothetical protein
MKTYLSLAPTPLEEDCAQVGRARLSGSCPCRVRQIHPLAARKVRPGTRRRAAQRQMVRPRFRAIL